MIEGIRFAGLAGAGRGEDAGKIRVRRDAQSQHGNNLAGGRTDGRDGKHGGHTDAQVALLIRQQRHAGEGPRDQGAASQALGEMFRIAGRRLNPDERIAPRSHHLQSLTDMNITAGAHSAQFDPGATIYLTAGLSFKF